MLLKALRTNTRTIIWIVVAIFIGSFIIGSVMSARGQGKSHAAIIFNKKIAAQTYTNFYNLVFYSPRIQELLAKNPNVPESFLTSTTLQYIALYDEAKRLGISVTDAAVRTEILRRFSPQGYFNRELYEQHIRKTMRTNPRTFEEGVRKELMINALLDSFKKDITVTDAEVRDVFNLETNEYTIAYLIVGHDAFTKNIAVLPEQLTLFYNENPALFTIPEKYDLSFYQFSPANYLTEVSCGQSEIEDYYDSHREQLVDADGKPMPLEKVSEAIKERLLAQKAFQRAQREALATQAAIQAERNFLKGTELTKLEPQRTGFKSAEELASLFGWAQNFYERLPDIPPNTIQTIATPKGVFITLLSNKEYSSVPAFADIIDQVKTKYVQAEARKAAQATAQKYYEQLKTTPNVLETIAKELGQDIHRYGPFAGNTPSLPDLGSTSRLINVLSKCTAGTALEPYEIENGYALVTLQDIRKQDDAAFAQQKATYKERILGIKTNQMLTMKINDVITRANIKNLMAESEDPFADIVE